MLEKIGCEKIFTDHATGVNDKRQGLQDLLSILRKDDIVFVYRIDRIFRSLRNMVDLIDRFNLLGVKFKSISESQFDTTTANGNLLIQLFSVLAEFERNLISERTKVGLESARRRNKLLGRPKGIKKETLKKYNYALHLYNGQNTPIEKACEIADLGKTTFYRVDNYLKLKSIEAEKKKKEKL
jgi:DNA invertase Pin-like site-specific DNA recombinase